MPEERFPIQWAGQQALVTRPQHIDRGNAGQIREQLLWIINRGAAVLIADLTRTCPAITPARTRWAVLITVRRRTGPSCGW